MSDRAARWIFFFLVLGQLIFLSTQVPAVSGEASVLSALWTRIVGPIADVVNDAALGVGRQAVNWRLRERLLKDNKALREENELLRREVTHYFGLEEDLERIGVATNYARAANVELQLADVVFADRTSWLQALLLQTEGGAPETNQPVVTHDGLLGRVVLVSGSYAKVQILTDRAASVGVMVQRTRRQGVARGDGAGRLTLEFIPLQDDLQLGDRVVTAGIDGVYPRGVPVGTVVRADRGTEMFFEVELEPAVDLSLVDHAYLLVRQVPSEELKLPSFESPAPGDDPEASEIEAPSTEEPSP